MVVDAQRQPLIQLALQVADQSTLVAYTGDGRLRMVSMVEEESFMDDETTLVRNDAELLGRSVQRHGHIRVGGSRKFHRGNVQGSALSTERCI